jgi:hypothetical protein
MIEFVSQDLLGKITKNNQLTHQLHGPLQASIIQNEVNLQKVIQAKEVVTAALKQEQGLYEKNLALVNERQMLDLQSAIEDFSHSTTKFAGENMILDMISAKRSQIEVLEAMMFEYEDLIGYCGYINNNMLAIERSLLKISQGFERLVA